MPKKLLIWYWGRLGGGALMTLLLARHLIEAGHGDDIALSLSEQNELIGEFGSLGVALSALDTFAGKPSVAGLLRSWPALRRSFRAELERFQPKTVLVPMLFGAAMPLLLSAGRAAGRCVYVVHDARAHRGESISLEQNVAQFLLLRMANRLVTVSHSVRIELLRRSPRVQIAVEPLAGLYRSRRGARSAPQGRRLRFLVAGRQVAYKGFERLAAALRLIGTPEFDVVIAGDGPESVRVAELFGEQACVELRPGWASADGHQKPFDECDVQLCPYDEASQSGLVCDALAASMPTIVTPVGALPEQIGFGKAGWICPDMSPAALAALMTRVASGQADYAAASAGCKTVLDTARAASNWPRTLGLGE